MAIKKIIVTEQSEEAVATPTPLISEDHPKEEPQAPPPRDSSDEASKGSARPASSVPHPTPVPTIRPRTSAQMRANMLTRRPKRQIVVLSLLLALAIIGLFSLLKNTGDNPLPETVKQKVHFSVYYPQSSSMGYSYLSGSAQYAGGKVSYILKTGDPLGGGPYVRVSEQALTGQGPDLNKLQNFSILNTPAGQAAVSPSGNVLNGVLVTKKTLIILNGLDGVSRSDFIKIINTMSS